MAGSTSIPTHTRQQSKSGFANIVQQAYEKPPAFSPFEKSARSPLNPKSWSLRRWLIISLIAIATLVIVIVITVEIIHANRYPDYSKLKYRLAQTYSGESFFDDFNYFSGYARQCSMVAVFLTSLRYDPAQGFVQ